MRWVVRNQNGSGELYHYGVPGMKWGVRRTPEQLGHKQIPNAKRLKNYSGKAYFISEKELDGQTLEPRVPDNFLTNGNNTATLYDWDFKETKIYN